MDRDKWILISRHYATQGFIGDDQHLEFYSESGWQPMLLIQQWYMLLLLHFEPSVVSGWSSRHPIFCFGLLCEICMPLKTIKAEAFKLRASGPPKTRKHEAHGDVSKQVSLLFLTYRQNLAKLKHSIIYIKHIF